jgi:DNA-binding transcriptional LysR family regulator
MLDWENLHCFAAFARQRSLSAAARELGVEHATVSRRIAALENELKLKLVDRRARAYYLTADGERIAAMAQRMEEEVFAVERAAQAGQDVLSGEISITAPPMMTAWLIAPRLHEFQQQHPGIRVRLITETRIASLPRREADLAIRLSRPTEPDLVARKIGSLKFWLYGTKDYLNRHAPGARGFLAYDESMELSEQQQWLRAVLAGRPLVMQSNNLDVQYQAARHGAGIINLPFFMGDHDAKLSRVEDEEYIPLVREIWLAVHSDLRDVPIVRVVMPFITTCLLEGLGISSHGK